MNVVFSLQIAFKFRRKVYWTNMVPGENTVIDYINLTIVMWIVFGCGLV